jgi:hypothetical protein
LQPKTPKKIHRRRTTCRSCGGSRLDVFLDLGPQPLANALPATPADFDSERTFPLDVAFCPDCALVQLVDVIDPEVLFGHYLYVSGTSSTMAAHWQRYAGAVRDELGLEGRDLVCEAAANDGSLLARFKELGCRTLGIEPARNIAAMARERGIETIDRFFDSKVAEEVRESHGPAKAAIANNVLAHVDDPIDFLRGLRTLVDPDGSVIVEAPYLGDFVRHLEYDTIYHEHLCYFSVTALMGLFERAGMRIARIDRQPIHGGSLRIWARSADALKDHAPAVRADADAERRDGFAGVALYQYFAEGVRRNRERLRSMILDMRARGESVAAYGAPAKGNTLLNYCSLSTDLVAFTVDKNPLKVGRFTPGVHLPILEVLEVARRRPDYLLILPWNLADEIVRQENAYRRAGGRFIIPIPEPRIVA